MKILGVCLKDVKNPYAGGGTRIFHELLAKVAKKGHDVTLVSSAFLGAPEEEKIDEVRIKRLTSPSMMFLKFPYTYLTELRESCDVVIENIYGIPWLTPFYAKCRKIVLVYHLHRGLFFDEFVQKNRILGFAPAMLGLLLEASIPIIYKDVPFITSSKPTAKDLLKMGIRPGRLYYIQEGINLDRYKPISTKNENPMMVYVGRLRRYKGVHLLLMVMRQILGSVPNVKLMVAGSGDYLTELKNLAEKLKLSRHVKFLGRISEEEKIHLLSKAHVFIHPSKREGFATTIIEANACGTVGVGFDLPGIREAVVNGKTGVLVPYGDLGALAEACIKLLTDKESYQIFRLNALEWARFFNEKDMMDKLERTVSMLIEGKNEWLTSS